MSEVPKSERLQVLEMIESGAITPAQGLELLRALSGEAGAEPPSQAVGQEELNTAKGPTETAGSTGDLVPSRRWEGVGQVALGLGVTLLVLGAYFLYRTTVNPVSGIWFLCAWVPFLGGLGLTLLAWYGRSARWIHVRIHQKRGETPARIAFSLPVPLRLSAWALRTFGGWIPALNETGLDELIQALETEVGPEPVMLVDIQEGEDGEQVQVYLG